MARVKIAETSDSYARIDATRLSLGDLREFVKATEDWPSDVRVLAEAPAPFGKEWVSAMWQHSRKERKA